jgi:hypothetical protein
MWPEYSGVPHPKKEKKRRKKKKKTTFLYEM